jgi:hypothetical protein
LGHDGVLKLKVYALNDRRTCEASGRQIRILQTIKRFGSSDRRNVQTSIGRRVIGRAPDPTQPIAADSVPGDLQIYVKPQT